MENMIGHVENPKDSTQKLPEVKSSFNKAAANKVIIQKLIVFSIMPMNN